MAALAPGAADQSGSERKVIALKKAKRETPEIQFAKHKNHNEELCKMLGEIGIYEKVGGDKTKYKVYERAVQTLKHLDHALASGAEAQKLNGIGKKIGAKIDEALETGTIRKLEKFKADEDLQVMRLFQEISGVGPSAAAKWVKDLGLRSLEELRESSAVSLNHHQKVGLQYFEEFRSRIPRAEVTALGKVVEKASHEIDTELVAVVAGSYRRGRPDSGDIDVLLTHPSYFVKGRNAKAYAAMLDKLVANLSASGFLTDHLVNGANKYNGVCMLKKSLVPGSGPSHRRIDILLLPWDEWACGLLYFTGSGFFNVQMRTIALERGYTLNERNIRPIGVTGMIGQPIPVNSEEDIFTVLDMEFKTPQQRDL